MLTFFFYLFVFVFETTKGTFTYIAGYEPESEVSDHSRIDLDVAEIMDFVGDADFASAKAIYENGKNSVKGDGSIRSLKGFSVNNCKLKGEKYFDIYNTYWKAKGLTDCQYADDIMQAAFDGTAVGTTGFKFEGAITGHDDFRNQAVKKGVLYLNVFMYTIWEMQDAINDCIEGDIKNNIDAVHAWDEAVAFYTGSAEGVERGGVNGLDSGTAHMMFTLAEKRCKNFGTCTADFDNNPLAGYSEVNDMIFQDFEKMKSYLKPGSLSSTFNCQNAYLGKDNIVRKMLVPMVQGSIRYLFETSDRVEPTGATAKELGELWAFVTGILPMVNSVDSSVAEDLYKYVWELDRSKDDFSSLKAKLESTYSGLGITCEEVGTLCDKAVTTSCTAYSDTEVSYDTAMCTESTNDKNTSGDDDDNDGMKVARIVLIVAVVLLAIALIVSCYYIHISKQQYEALKATNAKQVSV